MKRLYVVGIGPGGYEGMTMEAVRVLEDCDVIVGYTGYVELVREAFPQWEGKRFLTTGMKQERERCRMALELAEREERVAMVCSGDASVLKKGWKLRPWPTLSSACTTLPAVCAGIICSAPVWRWENTALPTRSADM